VYLSGVGRENIAFYAHCILLKRTIVFKRVHFKLCKAASFIMSVRLCACINSAPTGRIYVKLRLGTSVKTCRENPDLVKIGPKYLAFYMTL